MCGTAYMWKSEEDLQELVLFSHLEGLGAHTQVARLGSGQLYQLSHHTGFRTLISKTRIESSTQKERECNAKLSNAKQRIVQSFYSGSEMLLLWVVIK